MRAEDRAGRSSLPPSPRELLERWRAQGGDRRDPVRFHHLDALERRAAASSGPVRQRLEARLGDLLAAHAAVTGSPEADAADAPAGTPAAPAHGALADLLERMATRVPASSLLTTREAAAAGGGALAPDAYPELPMLEQARQRWSQLRSRSQLRQSLGEVPENAGPLNSGRLVHRSLGLMRSLSPAYLQHFLAYVDSLSWLQQMHVAGAERREDAAGKPVARKRTRNRASAR